jgi:hypothetical protein
MSLFHGKFSIVDYVQLNLFQLYDILNIGQKNHVILHLIMFSYMGNVFWNILFYKHEYHTEGAHSMSFSFGKKYK